jgi:hemerythrin-like domain-containing protein
MDSYSATTGWNDEVAMTDLSKRGFIHTASSLTIAGGIISIGVAGAAENNRRGKGTKDDMEEAVTPPEDLMREHGVLDRVLLVYEAVIRRFGAGEDFDPAVLTDSATIVRDFIQNYHEKSEENYVFPRFKRARQMVPLVDTLLAQHQAGRRVTEEILRLTPASRAGGDDRRRLVGAMQTFIAMYRPHAAREDTDLFPKLRRLVSSNEYDAMAEEFEKKEHELFGEDGFDKMADRIAQLEQRIGIHDLNQFTPH